MPPREGQRPNQPFIASPDELASFRPLTPEETARVKGEPKTGKRERTREGQITVEQAETILGPDCHGPEAVEQTFGIKIPEAEVPAIPFTAADLERAKALGQMLVLRADTAPDGQPLTMKKMDELLRDRFAKEKKGKVLYNTDWYKYESFFTEQPPKLRWALVSKDTIPNSTSQNYLEQTQTLADYLTNDVFNGKAMPKEYAEAIAEFNAQKAEIEKTMETDWQKAAEMLANLQITELTRPTPAEILYDILIHFQTTGERLLEKIYAWSRRRSSVGKLVYVGVSDADGVIVDGWHPDGSSDDIGAPFSRSR